MFFWKIRLLFFFSWNNSFLFWNTFCEQQLFSCINSWKILDFLLLQQTSCSVIWTAFLLFWCLQKKRFSERGSFLKKPLFKISKKNTNTNTSCSFLFSEDSFLLWKNLSCVLSLLWFFLLFYEHLSEDSCVLFSLIVFFKDCFLVFYSVLCFFVKDLLFWTSVLLWKIWLFLKKTSFRRSFLLKKNTSSFLNIFAFKEEHQKKLVVFWCLQKKRSSERGYLLKKPLSKIFKKNIFQNIFQLLSSLALSSLLFSSLLFSSRRSLLPATQKHQNRRNRST